MSRDKNAALKSADYDPSIIKKKIIEKSEMFKVIKELFNTSNI